MCRITGFWDFDATGYNLEETAEKMNNTLYHGGPDDGGIFVDQQAGLAIGNRRLAIIDLSPQGHQPMFSENRSKAIVFNGEIYNFAEIKEQLLKLGHKFRSHSDTEVILAAFEEWKINCVEKFRGMFAIAIWDKLNQKLLLIRDRVGVKPLYYYWHDGLFMFASETRAFLLHPKFKKAVNYQGVAAYLKFGYLPHPLSIWQNVSKLSPGAFLEIDKNKNIKIEKYWKLSDFVKKQTLQQNLDEDEVTSELEKRLLDSFKLRMVADVPVGVFLSGGIDSSIVAALLQKDSKVPLKTFTVGFKEKKYNEAGYSRKIANYLGTDHTEVFCDEKDALEIVPKLAEIYDEPFGDSSAVPTFLVCKMAREKVKVALSGDGGDEFFAGYDKYWKYANLPIYKPYFRAPNALVNFVINNNLTKNRLSKTLRMLKINNIFDKFNLTSTAFFNEEIKRMLKIDDVEFLNKVGVDQSIDKEFYQLDVVSQWMYHDAFEYLPEDILAKVDRASMHNALETREPLLDQTILEFISALPRQMKSDSSGGKYILKKVLEKYLPREYWDRPKQGFSIPMNKWLTTDLKEIVEYYFSKEMINKHGIFDFDSLDEIKKYFYKYPKRNAFRIWYLLVFQMWAEKWL